MAFFNSAVTVLQTENQQRASKRLAQVVPVSIAIIFVILFVLFSNARDAGLVLLNVPFAAVGGIAALLLTGFNFSISAGIGFIALFGICIQNGVIMISDIKHNLHTRLSLPDAVKTGMRSRSNSAAISAFFFPCMASSIILRICTGKAPTAFLTKR